MKLKLQLLLARSRPEIKVIVLQTQKKRTPEFRGSCFTN